MGRTNFFYLLLSLLALASVGCAASMRQDDDRAAAADTFDGLEPIQDSRATKAWARPDLDLRGYTKIMIRNAGVEFRPGGETGQSRKARSQGGPYEITESQKTRVVEILTAAFRDELAASNVFEVVDQPGPDVLLIQGGMLDVISWVPPNPAGTGIYLVAVGEATLVLEIRDSITNAILVRAIDRRAAERVGGQMFESNRVNNAAEMRRLARRWARLLRERIEELMGAE